MLQYQTISVLVFCYSNILLPWSHLPGLLSSRDAVPQELEACLQGRGGEWMLIKYKPNRGIMHDGDFPHLSTKVTSIEPGKKRVILGLNCFPSSVGECCIRAPEHSLAFNRTVKLYQVQLYCTYRCHVIPLSHFNIAYPLGYVDVGWGGESRIKIRQLEYEQY